MAGMLKITLIKGMARRPEKQRKVLQGIGLKKVNSSVFRKDTPTTRGMVNAIPHLVRVEEISDETA